MKTFTKTTAAGTKQVFRTNKKKIVEYKTNGAIVIYRPNGKKYMRIIPKGYNKSRIHYNQFGDETYKESLNSEVWISYDQNRNVISTLSKNHDYEIEYQVTYEYDKLERQIHTTEKERKLKKNAHWKITREQTRKYSSNGSYIDTIDFKDGDKPYIKKYDSTGKLIEDNTEEVTKESLLNYDRYQRFCSELDFAEEFFSDIRRHDLLINDSDFEDLQKFKQLASSNEIISEEDISNIQKLRERLYNIKCDAEDNDYSFIVSSIINLIVQVFCSESPTSILRQYSRGKCSEKDICTKIDELIEKHRIHDLLKEASKNSKEASKFINELEKRKHSEIIDTIKQYLP